MDATLNRSSRRLSFLAVMLWLCSACLVQAHIKTASLALPPFDLLRLQAQMPSLTLRLERERPHHCRERTLEEMAHLTLELNNEWESQNGGELRIGILADGNPISKTHRQVLPKEVRSAPALDKPRTVRDQEVSALEFRHLHQD